MDPDSQTFLNRRVFAYADTGIPDGLQIDKNGNVYAGCGDGVQVRISFFSTFYSISFSHITRGYDTFLIYIFSLSLYQSVICCTDGKPDMELSRHPPWQNFPREYIRKHDIRGGRKVGNIGRNKNIPRQHRGAGE